MEAKLKVKLPSLPNFITVDSSFTNKAIIDVADLSDTDLKELGKEWTIALLNTQKIAGKNHNPQ